MKKITLTFFSILIASTFLFAQKPEIGQEAPEIALESPDGTIIKLSDLRGKVVLIDFWASWCAPCRRENPNLVGTYHQYKDTKFKNGDGFVILSVSLDLNREQWLSTIEEDKMDWPYHISDLKGWSSEVARLYEIRMIPTSYLIDGDGIVIDENLRGAKLSDALKKLRARKFWW